MKWVDCNAGLESCNLSRMYGIDGVKIVGTDLRIKWVKESHPYASAMRLYQNNSISMGSARAVTYRTISGRCYSLAWPDKQWMVTKQWMDEDEGSGKYAVAKKGVLIRANGLGGSRQRNQMLKQISFLNPYGARSAMQFCSTTRIRSEKYNPSYI